MAINLVSLISQFLTPQLVGTIARAIGVNEAVAQRVVAAAVPVILASLGTAAAAPGGAQKVSDAISNSDPDILAKLGQAASGGNAQFLNEGASLLSGVLGGGGLTSIIGALSQYAGAPQGAVQALVGAATHATIGTIGQQDPSNWSDPAAMASFLASQKSAISAALPPDLARTLSGSGLLAGLGGLGAAAAQTATATASSAASATTAAASSAVNRTQTAATSTASRFPIWAIVLIVVIVLIAIYWFMNQKSAEPAKTGLLGSPAIEYALLSAPTQEG
jgi:hypothetical protein